MFCSERDLEDKQWSSLAYRMFWLCTIKAGMHEYAQNLKHHSSDLTVGRAAAAELVVLEMGVVVFVRLSGVCIALSPDIYLDLQLAISQAHDCDYQGNEKEKKNAETQTRCCVEYQEERRMRGCLMDLLATKCRAIDELQDSHDSTLSRFESMNIRKYRYFRRSGQVNIVLQVANSTVSCTCAAAGVYSTGLVPDLA